MNWLALTFFNLLLVITYSLIYKYINTKIKNNTKLRLQSSLLIFICMGIIGALMLAVFKLYYRNKNKDITMINDTESEKLSLPVVPIITASLIIVFVHILHLMTYGSAPNPGIPMSIISLSGLFVYLASCYLYKTKVSAIKITGIIMSTIGIAIVII